VWVWGGRGAGLLCLLVLLPLLTASPRPHPNRSLAPGCAPPPPPPRFSRRLCTAPSSTPSSATSRWWTRLRSWRRRGWRWGGPSCAPRSRGPASCASPCAPRTPLCTSRLRRRARWGGMSGWLGGREWITIWIDWLAVAGGPEERDGRIWAPNLLARGAMGAGHGVRLLDPPACPCSPSACDPHLPPLPPATHTHSNTHPHTTPTRSPPPT
jgi:hypothetical protein